MANCCKILKKFDQALLLYKKALEYVWILKDEECEAKIYDRMGMIYFLCGEIRKARFYHDRSLEYKLESYDSPSIMSSEKLLTKFHDTLRLIHVNTISHNLLSKLGINVDIEELNKNNLFITGTFNSEENNKINKTLKFSSNLNIETLLDNLFLEKDFGYEIPSPRNPKGYSDNDIKLHRVDNIGAEKRDSEGRKKNFFDINVKKYKK